MSYYVRMMQQEDITQVKEIDREAFPTQLPPPNFQRELRNQMNDYIVVCDDEETIDLSEVKTPSKKGLVSKLAGIIRRNNSSGDESPPLNRHKIIGFAGFWVVGDEAHIINIAVREAYRRRGLGELLLMSIIDLSKKRKARNVTLEVRVSNSAAQGLYAKHGFNYVGVRKSYYIDNSEDALLMSTEDINTAAFQAKLRQLKEAYYKKQQSAPAQKYI